MKTRLKKNEEAAKKKSQHLELAGCQRELRKCQKRIAQMEGLFAREIAKRGRSEEKLNLLNVELSKQSVELKAVNQTLLDSEQRLRIAIETGRIGLFVWDSTQLTNPGDWSRQLKEIFGMPLDAEVTHDMFLKCVHPEDRAHIDRCVQEALQGKNGGEYKTEYRTIKADDGSEHWVTARGQAFFDAAGKAIRFIGTVMDITERKQAEQSVTTLNFELGERIAKRTADLAQINEALKKEIDERKQADKKLRQSEQNLAEGQRLTKTGSWVLDFKTGNTDWSVETCRIFGFPDPPPSPHYNEFRARVRPEDREAVDRGLRESFETCEPRPLNYEFILPNGVRKQIETISQPVRDEAGELKLMGTVMDVTVRKQAEDAIRASEQWARGQTEALTKTLDALARESVPDRIVEHVLRTITRQLNAHSSSVWEREEATGLVAFKFTFENGRLVTKADSVLASIRPSLKVEDVLPWPEVFRTGRPQVLEDIRQGPEFPWRAHVLAQGVICILIVPMMIAGKVEGVIGIRFTQKRTFRAEELELAQALANQTMLAMQLARLSAQSRDSAVMAERNRLARDMHDTLAQGFTGVIMQLEAAKGEVAKPDFDAVMAHIERASELARTSLGEARRSVRALRPRALMDGTLCAALDDLLKRMTSGTKLQAEFVAEGINRAMPPDWEEGLLHIAQESLTNTIKHAQASRFSAKLSFAKNELLLQLVDDGRGFESQAEHEGFGLLGMKERVERMAGQFVIRTKSGQGTEILITLNQPG